MQWTNVDQIFIDGRVNNYLSFGRFTTKIVDGRRSVASLEPGAVFGYVRWRAGDYGTEHWSAYVLKAGRSGECIWTVPGVTPGAHILVFAKGVAQVRRYFKILDSLDESADQGIPHAEVDPDYWRRAGCFIVANAPKPPPYTADRHAAFLAMRKLTACTDD